MVITRAFGWVTGATEMYEGGTNAMGCNCNTVLVLRQAQTCGHQKSQGAVKCNDIMLETVCSSSWCRCCTTNLSHDRLRRHEGCNSA